MKNKPEMSADAAELRRRAEVRLSESGKNKATHPATEAEAQRLVHELQVHQIELEMQNEELMQSRAETEAGLKQYTDLYELAPAGYFTLNRQGAIRQVNLTGGRMLGVERSALMRRSFGLFVSAKFRPAFNTFLKNVFAGQGKETCELILLINGNDPLWAHMEATAENREECRAVVVDITALKRAEEELRALSIHDALTGLYNRGFFEEEMARLERGRQFPVSLVIADVNCLKETNDREGHAAGDVLLKRVAQVLTSAFRGDDVVARLGGDEFAVLLPGTAATAAEVALRRVRQALQEHNRDHAGALIRLSFGVSTAENRAPLSDVLKEADASMYREKRGHDASEKTRSRNRTRPDTGRR